MFLLMFLLMLHLAFRITIKSCPFPLLSLPLSGTDSPARDVTPVAPICQRPKTANNHRSTSKATTTPLVHHIFKSLFAADGVLDDADDVKSQCVDGKDDKIVVKANKDKKTPTVATKKELGGFS